VSTEKCFINYSIQFYSFVFGHRAQFNLRAVPHFNISARVNAVNLRKLSNTLFAYLCVCAHQ